MQAEATLIPGRDIKRVHVGEEGLEQVFPAARGMSQGSCSLCHHLSLKKLTPRPHIWSLGHQMEEITFILPFLKDNERMRWDPLGVTRKHSKSLKSNLSMTSLRIGGL